MLTVDYNRKMGEIILSQKQDENKQEFTINEYWCNGLAAFIYEYKSDDGKDMCKLMNFFADKQHLKNMLKDKQELFIGNIIKISLNMAYKENELVLEYFAKMGHTVECFYEPIKKQ